MRIKTLFFLCLSYSGYATADQSIARPLQLTSAQIENLQKKNFNLLGALQLKSAVSPDQRLMEFSGIAWDNDEQSLILLSDRAFIVHAKPVFTENKLTDLLFTSYHRLLDKKGKALRYKPSDSEGLALINSRNNLNNDTELLISFERVPRVLRYTTDGKFLSEEKINNELNDIKNYESENKSMEAITFHEKYKIITGPERALDKNSTLSLHNLDKKEWLFSAESKEHSSLVGLTTLPNNQLIALERIFPGVFAGVTNIIHLITLNDDSLEQQRLVKLNPEDGFNENFEGISWHKDNHFFMISDDNENLFQRSLLLYFEIPELNIN
ncbi:MAG: esterase-like activity of phytase family protein [Gammaproteobacteria bacterium]